MSAKKLKLYVWAAFSPDYHDGLAFAIAESKEEAKYLVRDSYGCEPSKWGPVEELNLDKVAYSKGGGG